ncbi:MAG: penicillin-binding transpeptidase domain-containing protein [Blastocatellia bacterium]
MTAISLLVPVTAEHPALRLSDGKQSRPFFSSIQAEAYDLAPTSPCAKALAQRSVCAAANKRALEIMTASQVKAFTVIQDVRTGALVAFAATHPSELDVTTPVNPLSLSKLLLAASWWDNGQPDSKFVKSGGTPDSADPAHSSGLTVHELLVHSNDSAGRQMALALRKSVGTATVIKDLNRYGLGQPSASPKDGTFWGELDPLWKARLLPAPAFVSLDRNTTDTDWADSLSVGEARMTVTALHVSRFLQAVGNRGLMVMPTARTESGASYAAKELVPRLHRRQRVVRIMRERTALRLQSAMRDVVQRGTARKIAKALVSQAWDDGTGWRIGGKTGSGIALLPQASQVDGWFAGLLFDPHGSARLTIVTFVRSGGFGGEAAANISAELARYIIGRNASVGN